MRHIAHRQCPSPDPASLQLKPSRLHDDTDSTVAARTVTASSSPPPPPSRRARHASVEPLSVPVTTAIASSCSVSRDTLADINPTFELDTNIVPIPPEQSAFSNCEKVVERDVEIYRQQAQSIRMYQSARLAHVISHNAQF